MQAPVATIAQFLTDQHKNDKAYSTINSYRSTISGIHPLVGGGPVGQHPDIKGVMAGIYNENPPQAKYAETWDVDRVLSHMKTWGDNETMHIRDLTVKLTMLIAITTACRAAEIQCLDKTRMTDKGTTIVCNLTRPTKVTKTGQALTHLTLYSYEEDEALDVTLTMRAYLHRTTEWRTSPAHNGLLLSTTKPHKPVATATVSSWLKQAISRAGINTMVFKGHSTRSASSSKAQRTGLPLTDIMQTANWSQAKTFHRHYNKYVKGASENFASNVLSLNVQC